MNKSITSTLILAVALVMAGTMVSVGLRNIAAKDRVVSVKGLDTRDVMSDYVVWPLSVSVTGNELVAVNRTLSSNLDKVQEFLVQRGFRAEDMHRGNVTINDNWEYANEHRNDNHYTVTGSLVVQTADVERVMTERGNLNELMLRGIIVRTNDWEVDYQFNGLNEIKPEMIENATRHARAAAQKFAADAQCRLGSIAYANQGQISVSGDAYQPWIKHVRVVTTVNYYLK